MSRLKTFFKTVWLGQCIATTYFAITRFYGWYFTTPRGLIPFYFDFIAGAIGIGLFCDWFLGIFG